MTAAGREDVFATLVMPELDLLLQVARSLTHDDADAEDLVHETLRQAFDAIGRFDGQTLREWLFTLMGEAGVSRGCRDPGRREPAGDFERIPGTPEPRPEAVSFSDTFDSAAYRGLCDLPPPLRTAVELVDVHGLSYREAAAALGLPASAFVQRLHRARRRIRAAVNASGLHRRRRTD